MLKIINFLPYYIVWHFSGALRDSWGIWKNFLWFIWRFFSISELSRTLFTPWQRLQEEYGKGSQISLENTLGSFSVNILMRLVGALIRVVVIIFGFLIWTMALLAGPVLFLAWIFLPVIVFVLLILGLMMLI